MADPAVRVTIEDLETGEKETILVPDNTYYLICTGTCEVSNTHLYMKSGTHQLTIRGATAGRREE